MGNQARVKDNATVVSTSTRNFPNRLGDDADVYLSSAEVAAIAAKLGRIPTVEEYLSAMQGIEPTSNDIYQYFMKMINEKKLKNKLVTMLREDWNGKKGYLTDNEMFKYCQFYTGDFWKKSEKTNKKSA
jgi:aconitase A